MEIELLLDSESGLKVPSSSIASEQFYRIPDEYVTPNPDTGREVTLLVETYHADNTSKVTSKTVTVYEKQENTYLISTDDIKTGDRILKPDSFKYHVVTADDLTAIGEIGLTGETRMVSNLGQRLTEIARLGFTKCIIPRHGSETITVPKGLRLLRVRNIREAIEIALDDPKQP